MLRAVGAVIDEGKSRARVALCAPSPLGEKETPNVHDVPGVTVTGIAPQVPLLLAAYSGSGEVALEIMREFVVPVL